MLKNKHYRTVYVIYWFILSCTILSCDMLPDLRQPKEDFALIVGDIRVSTADMEQDREFFSKYMPADFLVSHNETVTQQIIYYYILLDYAEKNSIFIDGEQELLLRMFGSLDVEKEFLHSGVNKHLWHKRANNMLICLKAMEHIAAGAEAVSDEDVLKYIDTNPNFFVESPNITFQQAIFDNINDAKSFLSDFKSGRYSDDDLRVSSEKAILKLETIYNMPKGNLPESLEKAVVLTPLGEIGELVKTEYGFHVFKVLSLSEGGSIEKDAAFNMAKSHLDNEEKINYITKQMENMYRHTKIDINEKVVAKLENS